MLDRTRRVCRLLDLALDVLADQRGVLRDVLECPGVSSEMASLALYRALLLCYSLQRGAIVETEITGV